ncbi:hypothetical protein [Lacticaseibacillus zhaodongensis]|uniref:hypothetical protein n=1 Tax=Lacticaseibacillus zhaodongensis TaxID=2668065 RepID=UPI0012D2CB49|nr:hypothetical protein [Lacticaseibacillus zhaodongensis]
MKRSQVVGSYMWILHHPEQAAEIFNDECSDDGVTRLWLQQGDVIRMSLKDRTKGLGIWSAVCTPVRDCKIRVVLTNLRMGRQRIYYVPRRRMLQKAMQYLLSAVWDEQELATARRMKEERTHAELGTD